MDATAPFEGRDKKLRVVEPRPCRSGKRQEKDASPNHELAEEVIKPSAAATIGDVYFVKNTLPCLR